MFWTLIDSVFWFGLFYLTCVFTSVWFKSFDWPCALIEKFAQFCVSCSAWPIHQSFLFASLVTEISLVPAHRPSSSSLWWLVTTSVTFLIEPLWYSLSDLIFLSSYYLGKLCINIVDRIWSPISSAEHVAGDSTFNL